MRYVAVVLLVACGSKKAAAPVTPPFVVTGTVKSLSTGQAVSCATPLTVKLYDVASFLIEPGAAKALATCTTDASANYTCSSTTLGSASTALIALIDDADNTKGDCISPTVTIAALCDPTCATSTAGKDGTLSGDDLAPQLVPPAHYLAALEAAAADSTLGSLVDSGAILNIVLDNQRVPRADAQPWLPLPCDSTLGCRAVILGSDGAPSAAKLTDAAGTWLAQVVAKNAQGAPAPVQIDLIHASDAGQGYGAVDCSATPVCYQPLPAKPLRTGELGAGIDGVVTVSFVTETHPKDGVCPINAAATAAGNSARAACPSR